MKKVIGLLLVGMLLMLTQSSAQNFQTDIYHSFNKQTGINIYKVTSSNFVYGVGGSYMFSTYTGETKGRHQELLNTYLGNDGNQLSNAFRTNYNVTTFTEDRGTVKALLGFNTYNTTFYSTLGLAFRSQYWKGTGWDGMPYFTSPDWNFYIYKNIPPRFLFGAAVAHTVNERIGMNLGWDNVSGVTYGITVNLKGSGLFEW